MRKLTCSFISSMMEEMQEIASDCVLYSAARFTIWISTSYG